MGRADYMRDQGAMAREGQLEVGWVPTEWQVPVTLEVVVGERIEKPTFVL